MTTEEFKRTRKWFVARRGKPHLMVSDNAKTLQAQRNGWRACTAITINQVGIQLVAGPWWRRFFEPLIGVMKSALSKVIENALLTFVELKETLLDFECFMNNRSLTYLGKEFDKQVITPNIILRGELATLLKENGDTLEEQADVARWLR
ncbi:uncharacterized protein LOC135693657 [Rhopilema esculentum]|uniref:uncharacterized protein LOC135693657 n=1 Tax=Rhopilema esculentum TaxID=499914 RepID=UPI0031DC5810